MTLTSSTPSLSYYTHDYLYTHDYHITLMTMSTPMTISWLSLHPWLSPYAPLSYYTHDYHMTISTPITIILHPRLSLHPWLSHDYVYTYDYLHTHHYQESCTRLAQRCGTLLRLWSGTLLRLWVAQRCGTLLRLSSFIYPGACIHLHLSTCIYRTQNTVYIALMYPAPYSALNTLTPRAVWQSPPLLLLATCVVGQALRSSCPKQAI